MKQTFVNPTAWLYKLKYVYWYKLNGWSQAKAAPHAGLMLSLHLQHWHNNQHRGNVVCLQG